MEVLRGWSRLTHRLYVWDYTTNFAHYLLPFPNFAVLDDNVRKLAAHGVAGVCEQGNYSPGGSGELAELRSWVPAQLLLNPRLDGDALIGEFLDGVYGAAAPAVRRYLALRKDARRKGGHVRIFDGPDRPDPVPDDVREWDAVLAEAAAASAGDPALATRVERLRMPVWYTIVSRRIGDAPSVAAAARQLAQAAGRHKLTHFRERGREMADDLTAFELEALRRPLPSPPKGVVRGEDFLFRLAAFGKLTERLADPSADDGVAVRMAGRTTEWAVQ